MNGACPKCGGDVEFRKNETRRKCPKCGVALQVIYDVEDGVKARIRVEDE